MFLHCLLIIGTPRNRSVQEIGLGMDKIYIYFLRRVLLSMDSNHSTLHFNSFPTPLQHHVVCKRAHPLKPLKL